MYRRTGDVAFRALLAYFDEMLSADAKKRFLQDGFYLEDNFLSATECDELLAEIESYRSTHPLHRIQRKHRQRSLDYFVIDGHAIKEHLKSLMPLYRHTNDIVNFLDGNSLVPLQDWRASLNANITPPGGEYRWHYDRNRVTALLYLNSVTGGEIEFCPKYRIKLSRTGGTLQKWLDTVLQEPLLRKAFGRQIRVAPHPGRLLVMRGDICLHSVRAVTAQAARINLVMSYDLPDSTSFNTQLDQYLYESERAFSKDPNY